MNANNNTGTSVRTHDGASDFDVGSMGKMYIFAPVDGGLEMHQIPDMGYCNENS
jgi:hypothetical protein